MGWQVEFDRIREFNSLRPLQDPPIGIVKNPRWVGRVCQEVADQVERVQRNGQMALTLGGDHSLGLGTLTGTARAMHAQGKEFCCIWVDAHADINTIETTPSGNLHGMPLSFLLGLCDEGLATLDGFEWLAQSPVRPVLSPHRLVYIGLRDVDAGEKELLKRHGIKAFSMHQVDKWGIGKVVEMALDHVNPNRDLPIHLSFDVDALDPSVAPATGMLVIDQFGI